MRICYLCSEVTRPGSPTRRDDAFEHDYQVAALRDALTPRGYTIDEKSWDDTSIDGSAYDAAIIGTTWDYWDRADAFLTTLDAITASGALLFNPVDLVRWNSRKTYLRDLEDKGLATIPTLWLDHPSASDLDAAFDRLSTDQIVVKRQIGAGAVDQKRYRRGETIEDYPFAAMVQPFIPSIQTEGEYSFIMIDGELSHALIKRSKPGDYRIQSLYGGVETPVDPAPADLETAKRVVAALETPPLYARVDMVRGEDGDLLLIELELIEPYLYPEQGPQLGERFAAALERRLG